MTRNHKHTQRSGSETAAREIGRRLRGFWKIISTPPASATVDGDEELLDHLAGCRPRPERGRFCYR
jgi:hypothetical protein